MVTEDGVRAEVMRLLRYANRSAIARELKVSDEAVSNWAKGKHTSPRRLEQLQALLGAPVPSQGQTKEAAPVTGRLLASAIAIERKLGITSEELAAAEAEANILLVRLLDTNGTPPPPAASGGAAVSDD